jgi:hypothetical protein
VKEATTGYRWYAGMFCALVELGTRGQGCVVPPGGGKPMQMAEFERLGKEMVKWKLDLQASGSDWKHKMCTQECFDDFQTLVWGTLASEEVYHGERALRVPSPSITNQIVLRLKWMCVSQ